jgi:purine-cytosine permease-like protein
MSSLPPPIPGAPKSGGVMKPPPVPSGFGGSTTTTKIHAEDYVRASILPLIIALVATVASLVLTLFFRNVSTWVHLLGYLLTPFLVIICAGLDSVQQRRKATTDLYFLENRKYSIFLRALSALALLISIPHINGIATTVAAWVADL